jgi:Arc/MetJ family transcription regulator
MRTNIVIDDTLMRDALAASGLPSKRAAVEAGLRSLVSLHRQAGVRRLRGQVKWTGDLAKLRTGRTSHG